MNDTPDGWAIVPIHPTKEMLQAAFDTFSDNAEIEYKSMVNAAPKPPEVT